MPRIKTESVLEHLGADLRRALADAVDAEIEDADVDEGDLFRAFTRAAGRRCSTWVQVPGHLVQTDSGQPTLEAICDALNCQPADLLGFQPDSGAADQPRVA